VIIVVVYAALQMLKSAREETVANRERPSSS
jgi:hypothetical protein